MELTDQQAIDHLNTIINERESAVHLKEVLKHAADADSRVASAQADLSTLDRQLADKRVLLANIDAEYQKRETATKKHYDDVLDKVDKKVQQAELDAERAVQQVQEKVTEAVRTLEDMQHAIGMANQQKIAAEEAMKRSMDALTKAKADYDAYKAGLQ